MDYSKELLNEFGNQLANFLSENSSSYSQDDSMAEMFEYMALPGHKLRPGFVFLACGAVGGDLSKVLPVAAAVELLHKSTLIHDDIVDEDLFRRGIPTFHSKYGKEMGIVYGDFASSTSFEMLKKLSDDFDDNTVLKSFEVLSRMFKRVYLGQLQDLRFENSTDIGVDDYLTMVENKTGEVIKGSLELGALLGGGTQDEIDSLLEFGYNLSIAFQIKNDINNIDSDGEIRNNNGSDIKKKKNTLLVIKTLADKKTAGRLKELFEKDDLSDEDVNEIAQMFIKNGSIKYAHSMLDDYTKRAKNSLQGLKETRAKKLFYDITEYIGTSTYWKTNSESILNNN